MEAGLLKFYNSLDFESDQVLPGWTLSIHKSSSHDAYLLTVLLSADTSTGRVDVFASDEGGVIHQGQLNPVVIPARYVPLHEALPDLAPLALPQTNLLLASASRLLTRVAYSAMRGDTLPVQYGSCPSACCASGNCMSGQCYCFNCGYGNCPWCCTMSCSFCWYACGKYCACCP
jgi:hypothetical protein